MDVQKISISLAMVVGVALFPPTAASLAQGLTTRVSVDSAGGQGNGHSYYYSVSRDYSYTPSVSADGRYVAFSSAASNLVPGDTGVAHIFVHDRLTGETTRVSVDSAGGEGNADSLNPSLSANGRFVIFSSLASNLVPGDTNGKWDVFVHDLTPAPSLGVSLDQASFRAGETIRLWATVAPGPAPVTADVYVAVQLPDGTLLFLQGDESIVPVLQPIVSKWPISAFSGQIFAYTFGGGEPIGNYAWLATFTEPGTLNFIGPIVSAPFIFSP